MSYRTVAAKERYAKFYVSVRAINQYADAGYYPALLGYGGYDFADGATRGEHVVYDENPFPRVNAKFSSKDPFSGALLFRKYTAST